MVRKPVAAVDRLDELQRCAAAPYFGLGRLHSGSMSLP